MRRRVGLIPSSPVYAIQYGQGMANNYWGCQNGVGSSVILGWGALTISSFTLQELRYCKGCQKLSICALKRKVLWQSYCTVAYSSIDNMRALLLANGGQRSTRTPNENTKH
jgi:hypothetical protein